MSLILIFISLSSSSFVTYSLCLAAPTRPEGECEEPPGPSAVRRRSEVREFQDSVLHTRVGRHQGSLTVSVRGRSPEPVQKHRRSLPLEP